MRRLIIILCLFTLVACDQSGDSDSNPSILDQPRIVATAAPIDWTAAGPPVTLDNVASVQLLGRLDNQLHAPSTIFDHAVSPDGTLLAGLDTNGFAAWDLVTGETIFSIGRRPDANHVFFAPDKIEVYSLEQTGLVTIHDIDQGIEQNTFQAINGYEGQSAFYAEDGWLALGNQDGEVRVWDPLERQSLVTLDAHESPIRGLAFSGSGELLATMGTDTIINIWDWRNKMQVASFDNERVPVSVAFSPDDALLAVGTVDNIRLWNVDGSLHQLLATGENAVNVMTFSPDTQLLVNGGQVADMQIWDVPTGRLVARLPGVGKERLSAAFSPDGDLLLTSVLNQGATLWDMTTITESTINNAALDNGDNLIFAVDWTPDGRLLTLFGTTGSVYIWGIPAAE